MISLMKTRTGITVMISLMIAFFFFQVGDEDYSDFITVQSTFGVLLMGLISTIFSTALPSLTTFPEERPVFLREYATNHYSVMAYMVSRLTMELGLCAVQVTVGSTMIYILVAGFFVPPGLTMPDWLSWLRHIFPLTYGV